MPVRYEQNVIDFASISLAVAVLVFSLLVSTNNYSVRAERSHCCGLELNEILREMRFLAKDPQRLSHYKKFEDTYAAILRRYENTDQIDYTEAKISILKDKPVPFRLALRYYRLLSAEMFLYVIALALEFGFILRLVWN